MTKLLANCGLAPIILNFVSCAVQSTVSGGSFFHTLNFATKGLTPCMRGAFGAQRKARSEKDVPLHAIVSPQHLYALRLWLLALLLAA
jgi:hypothetical protein